MAELSTPLALNPDQVGGLRARDPQTGAPVQDVAVDALERALQAAHAQAQGVVTLAAALALDGSLTGPAKALRLRQAALQAGDRAATALDAARAQLVAAADQLQAQIAAPPLNPAAAAAEAEIRSGLRALRPAARAKAVAEALAADDLLVVGAALRLPLAAGLTADERGVLQATYQGRFHPSEVARLARLQRAVGVVERASQSLISFVGAAAEGGAAAEDAANRTSAASAAIA